jgi:hypothetical protein
MIPLLKIPEIVQHYAPYFRTVFSEAAFRHFQCYVGGLMVSENKTIEGINRLFVQDPRSQSSLNRFLTRSRFSREALNEGRLLMLQEQPETRIKPEGVLSIDDTLLSHYGRCFEKIAWLFDPSTQAYTWAHNLVGLHYSDEQTDYPIDFRLWEPPDLDRIEQGLRASGIAIRPAKESLKQQDPKKWRQYLLGLWRRKQQQREVQALYRSKLILAEQLLRAFVGAHPDLLLPVAFDSWYTTPAFCRTIDELGLPFVGALEEDTVLCLATGEQTLKDFAARLRQEHHASVAAGGAPLFGKQTIRHKGERESYYSYCATHRVKNFGKRRLVINHRQADLSDGAKVLISNRLQWHAGGITRIARQRWPIEVYHEEAKAEGLDRYQIRGFTAIERHIALVAVVYSMLRRAQHDRILGERLQGELESQLEGSLAAKRRLMQAQALWSLALFVSHALAQGLHLKEAMAPLLRSVAY